LTTPVTAAALEPKFFVAAATSHSPGDGSHYVAVSESAGQEEQYDAPEAVVTDEVWKGEVWLNHFFHLRILYQSKERTRHCAILFVYFERQILTLSQNLFAKLKFNIKIRFVYNQYLTESQI
jgi:hypothetical protein